MSRPNVIPTFRQRRCTNRGRNFVRSKRRSTYTNSGTLYLFLRLNNSETFVELVGARPLHLLSQTVLPLKSPTGAFIAALRKRGLCVLSAAVEGKNRPVATNFQFLKISCPSGTTLLQRSCVSEVLLVGACLPKPCRVTIKFIIVPWTEYNTFFDDTLLLFFAKIQLSSVTCREMQLFHVVSPIT